MPNTATEINLTDKDIRWVGPNVHGAHIPDNKTLLLSPHMPRFVYQSTPDMDIPFRWGHAFDRWDFWAVVPQANGHGYDMIDLMGDRHEINANAALAWLTYHSSYAPCREVLKPNELRIIGFDFRLQRCTDGSLSGLSGRLYTVSQYSEEIIQLGHNGTLASTKIRRHDDLSYTNVSQLGPTGQLGGSPDGPMKSIKP